MHIKPYSIGPIHFDGIGGIGMSGIAEILHNLDYTVQGSDTSINANIKRLQTLGVKTFHTQKAQNVKDAAVVVVSTAIREDNAEVREARQRGVPIVRRAEMLSEIMRLRPSIAVAGTHGKTTTTSLVAAVLDNAKLDPTVINGGIINAYGTNARLGKGEWIVAEADESDGSFTHLPVIMGIITNIEAEHLDYYKDIQQIRGAFSKFIHNIPFYGLGIVCVDHEEIRAMLPVFSNRRIITYGFSQDADIRICNLRPDSQIQVFDLEVTAPAVKKLSLKEKEAFNVSNIHLPMVGQHNVSNAAAALVAGLEMGIDARVLVDSFEAFSGVKRRFTKTGQVGGITIIDDYAHHPTEIKVVLEAARTAFKGTVVAVVQPHRYTRLANLLSAFAASLCLADHIVVAPVYSAGENAEGGPTHETLAQEVRALTANPVHTIESEDDLQPLLKTITCPDSCVICMGAGDITLWAQRLPRTLHGVMFPDTKEA